jgi:hypothetical protein
MCCVDQLNPQPREASAFFTKEELCSVGDGTFSCGRAAFMLPPGNFASVILAMNALSGVRKVKKEPQPVLVL